MTMKPDILEICFCSFFLLVFVTYAVLEAVKIYKLKSGAWQGIIAVKSGKFLSVTSCVLFCCYVVLGVAYIALGSVLWGVTWLVLGVLAFYEAMFSRRYRFILTERRVLSNFLSSWRYDRIAGVSYSAEEGCAVFVDVRNRRVVMKMSAKEYSLLAGNLRKRVKNVK